MHVFARSVSQKPGLSITPGGHYGQYFKKPNAKENCRSFSRIATCSNSHLQPLAQAATCSHLQPLAQAATCSHLQPLAATCQSSHLADTCSHLQPLGRHLTKQPLGSPLQPLAATCSHLHPLAATCSHLAATWQPLGSHVLKQPLGSHLQPLAATRRHLPQVAAASGCQVASFLKIQLRTSCAHNANLSTLSTF